MRKWNPSRRPVGVHVCVREEKFSRCQSSDTQSRASVTRQLIDCSDLHKYTEVYTNTHICCSYSNQRWTFCIQVMIPGTQGNQDKFIHETEGSEVRDHAGGYFPSGYKYRSFQKHSLRPSASSTTSFKPNIWMLLSIQTHCINVICSATWTLFTICLLFSTIQIFKPKYGSPL